MRLKGKAALVTGAGRGSAMASPRPSFAKGARVACLDVKGEVAEAAARRLGGFGVALKADISNRGDVERAAREAIEALGHDRHSRQ